MSKQVHARRVHGTQCRTRIAQQVAEMVDDFIYVSYLRVIYNVLLAN